MHGEEDHIHLALSPWDLTDDYNRHAGVTLLSFLDHCPKDEKVTVHLLYDEKLCIGKEKETEYNKQCYQEIAERYNCELIYHHVELPESLENHPNITEQWSAGALLRLFLPELLPEIDKIIYLDCDVVVNTDVSKLWEISLENYYLAACLDDARIYHSSKRCQKFYSRVGIPLERYFNSGVIILNLSNIRIKNPDFKDVIFTFMYENPVAFPDQDALNWYCQGNYLTLNQKYCVFSWWENAMEYDGDCIIHYTIGKPWKLYNGTIDDYYWKYLIKTPWCKDVETYLHYIRNAPAVENAISLLEKNFLEYISGNKINKAIKLISFTILIWRSVCLWIWKIIRERMDTIGLL